MNEQFKYLIEKLELNPSVTEEKIKEAEIKLNIRFPVQYKEFMSFSNGAEGNVGEDSYLQIYSVEEVVEIYEINSTDETLCLNHETRPVICFASDGGGTYYAFDKSTEDSSIISFPAVSIISEEYELCGNTFIDFLQNLYNINTHS